jgi:hypothetical protein
MDNEHDPSSDDSYVPGPHDEYDPATDYIYDHERDLTIPYRYAPDPEQELMGYEQHFLDFNTFCQTCNYEYDPFTRNCPQCVLIAKSLAQIYVNDRARAVQDHYPLHTFFGQEPYWHDVILFNRGEHTANHFCELMDALQYPIDEQYIRTTIGQPQDAIMNDLFGAELDEDIASDDSSETTYIQEGSSHSSSAGSDTEQHEQNQTHTHVVFKTAYLTSNPHKDKHTTVLIDAGSVVNICGAQWAGAVGQEAEARGDKPTYEKRAVPLRISGVGSGHQEAIFDAVLPVRFPTPAGESTSGTIRLATVEQSTLPGLIGLQTLRANHCIIDFRTLEMHALPAEEVKKFTVSKPPGTQTFQCVLTPSGHLGLPCCADAKLKASGDPSLRLPVQHERTAPSPNAVPAPPSERAPDVAPHSVPPAPTRCI